MLLLLLVNLGLILGSNDIKLVPQHSLIDLKHHYISFINKYGFAISNYQKGNLILQPFKNIEYLYICKDKNDVYTPEKNCNIMNNLTANSDNDLGLYSQSSYLFFLFNNSELQMKYFFDESPYHINIDNDSDFKCFDFFKGYSKLLFYLDSNLNNTRIATFQYTTNVTDPNYNSTLALVDRNSMETKSLKNGLSLLSSFRLQSFINYSLYYSPPNGENIHSILCLSFRDNVTHLITSNIQVIPIVTPGYYNFSSYLEKEWNISSEYYPTTFYFYLDSTKIQNCSYEIEVNSTSDKGGCQAKKDDIVDNLYTIKIYSHKDSTISFKLFLEPKIIDENCHFGYNVSFNKTVGEYDPISHFNDILEKMMGFTIPMFFAMLFIAMSISFFPVIVHKCKCCK